MSPEHPGGMSPLEYHTLLAMASGPRYGYAIKETVEEESDGAVSPQAASLYRVLARLLSRGLVTEASPQHEVGPHPGRARKYYALTARGRETLAAEARRLKGAAALAEKRLRVARGGA